MIWAAFSRKSWSFWDPAVDKVRGGGYESIICSHFEEGEDREMKDYLWEEMG